MRPEEIARGLWRWTAPHPEWVPGATPGSSADWPQEVGCVLLQTEREAIFIDALPGEDERAFWRWADERCAARRVLALTTLAFHRRAREQLAARYGASTSRAKRNLPATVCPIQLRGAGETVFWLGEQRTLVPGDRLLGADGGGLRICPASWLRYLPSGIGVEDLRELLRPLLDLPIERVLVSHGEPVLTDGCRALAEALE
ncbi:MAG TPA: hypothetical protein VMB05_17935 [Solirubrobacteraceae bacterium]|nr:hypothetical protein [Solirubrobacteraceae bacterium]